MERNRLQVKRISYISIKKGGRFIVTIEALKAFIEKINQSPEHIKNEKDRVFQFDVIDHDRVQVAFLQGKAYLIHGIQQDADVTLTLSEKHLMKLLEDDLNPTVAFMTGQLKVDGKIGLALKLQELVRKYQKI